MEQQYRAEFNSYIEAEQSRIRQIVYCTNDVGKNCKESSGQVRKIKYVESFILLCILFLFFGCY